MRTRIPTLVVALCAAGLLTTACSIDTTTTAPTSGATTPGPAGGLAVGDPNAPMPAPHTCRAGQQDGQPLPDPHCTPGAINPAVTQATINSTICVSGWTKTVRPPTSVTSRMKKKSDTSYGLPTTEQGEYDHLISLELGGAPADPRNLWVEPGKIPNPKDAVENKLSEAVCSGLIPLTTAQQAIAGDWVTAIDTAGLGAIGGKLCLRNQPTRCATGRHGDND
jgi:hypothetical protein